MAISKNFVVKNGLEVATNLIVADTDLQKVGIGTTTPRYQFEVGGGIGATDLYISGFSTFIKDLQVGTSGSVFYVSDANNLVGIGTSVPAYTLDVRGPVSTGVTALYVYGDAQITGDLISYAQATSTNLEVTGIATVGATLDVDGHTELDNLNVSGVSTFASDLDINASVDISDNLIVSGISTFGTVQISSGIVTATSGIVTYYGDGQYLQNILSGVGVATAGGIVGTGATILDFRGAGISTVTVASGIATINITGGGGGGGSVSISSVAPLSPNGGDLWYSIDYGRTFVYYDEVALGIGSTAVWVDAAPFNIGVVDINDLTVGSLTVTNDASITGLAVTNLSVTNINASGIITASSFVGDGSGLTGTGSTVFNDTTTNQEFYLTFTDTTSGTITSTGISTSKLTYNPFSGEVTAVDYNSTSDQSLKTNIQTVDHALDIVSDLRGVSFDWKQTGKPSYGVIAQELEQVLPNLVGTGDIKTVNYNGIIGVLIEAIKELKSEMEELKSSK